MSVADAVPQLPSFLQDALKTDDKKPIAQPEPSALAPDWWRFFEVEGEGLQKRVQSTLERLEALLGGLPRESVDTARSSIELIRSNLKALPEARAQPNPEPPAPLAFQESYTLSQLLDIVERLRGVQVELQAEDYDVAAADKSIRAAHRRVDTLMAAYLNLASNDPGRLLRGLEIMAERSALAVADERLRVRRAELAASQTLLMQLSEERRVAAERLVAEEADRARLASAIAQAQRSLEQAQERLANDQSRAMALVGEDPEDRATLRYRQQRVVRASIAEASATVRLLGLRVQQQLVSLLLDQDDIHAQKLRRRLSEWRTQLDNIRLQTATWAGDSERERERAAELVAGMSKDTGAATSINLINDDRLRLAQETLVALQRLWADIDKADLVMQLTDVQLKHREGWLQDWLARAEQITSQAWQSTTSWFSASLFRIGDTPVTPLGLLRVVVIVTLAWFISYWLRRVLKRLGERRESANLAALYTIGRLSHYVIISIGFIVGLASIGIDFTNFALVAGAIAIGIGFGLQSIVNNFVSGLILLFERSLKVGDFVELASGVAGEVREMNVRSTLITTNDNIDIVVPNSEFMNTQVTNRTLIDGYCRIHLPFKAAYGCDKELVRQAGLEAAEKVPHTLMGIPGRNPGVWLVGFGENGLDFELVVWITPRAVKRPSAVHAAYMWEIETALRKYGIEIPLPQRDLRFREGVRGAWRESLAAEHEQRAQEDTINPTGLPAIFREHGGASN